MRPPKLQLGSSHHISDLRWDLKNQVRHQVRDFSSVHPTTFRVRSEIRSENYSSAHPIDDTPGLPWGVIPVRFGVFPAFFGPKKTEMDSDDAPGLPRLVIPVHFRVFPALLGQKTPKRTGMTSLGFPGLTSQSVSGFCGPFRPENPQTDWDDKPGLPRLVIPVCFGI